MGGKDSHASQRLWGGNPTSTSRETEIGGSHMSRKNSTAVGIGAAISGAAIAAFLSMGTAYADTPDISVPNGSEDLPWQNTDTGGFSELFGGTGSVQGVTDAQDDTT